MFNINQYWQIPIPTDRQIRQYKVILDTKMSVEHISQANIGKTDKLLLLPKYRPTISRIICRTYPEGPHKYRPGTTMYEAAYYKLSTAFRVGYVHIVHTICDILTCSYTIHTYMYIQTEYLQDRVF